MSDSPDFAALTSAIRTRKTEKVLCDPDAARLVPDDLAETYRQVVLQAVETAGWAPFHYPRNVEGVAEPWRAHILWQDDALKLARHLRDDRGLTSKEPLLAGGCSAMVLVTWLPESPEELPANSTAAVAEKQRARNQEHLAATAAMVQNFLLLCTAQGLGTYWSSGGQLGSREVFDRLGIAQGEQLLAAVFLEYPEMRDADKERKAGALRNKRGTAWFRETTL